MARRTTRRRIGVPDAFRRLPMTEEELAGLPSFRVIRVSTEAQDYRGGPEGQAHELDLAEARLGVRQSGLELRDASPGWDAGRLEPALEWASGGDVRVGLIPYFSRFMRDPMLAFAYRDEFHARGCVLYFADRRLLSSDPARQGDFGELAVKAHIDNLDRARAIASGMYAKFRTKADPGGQPALGFRRSGQPRPVLEPDPGHIADAVTLFELYATGDHSDETLALEAARLGFVSPVTGRPLGAKGVGELLRNPIYNGWVVRFRGFADEERVEAPWRRHRVVKPDGDAELEADPPVSDELWERVQEVRRRRSTAASFTLGPRGERSTVAARTPGATVAAKGVADRAYVPNLVCAGCGDALYGHSTAGVRRMYHPRPLCDEWRRASHARASFHAEVYEWQIAALLATATLDGAARARIMAALGPATPRPDVTTVRRLERELRELALQNAFGQVADDVYLPRRDALLGGLEAARQPAATSARIDPDRAIGYLDDLQRLWDAPLPDGDQYEALRAEYERRRADATAAGFGVLAALGPELVRAELADDPATAAPLALTLAPERAVLTGSRAEVLERLASGKRSRLEFAQTYEATRKRRWREQADGTFRSHGRGERTSASHTDLSIGRIMLAPLTCG